MTTQSASAIHRFVACVVRVLLRDKIGMAFWAAKAQISRHVDWPLNSFKCALACGQFAFIDTTHVKHHLPDVTQNFVGRLFYKTKKIRHHWHSLGNCLTHCLVRLLGIVMLNLIANTIEVFKRNLIYWQPEVLKSLPDDCKVYGLL